MEKKIDYQKITPYQLKNTKGYNPKKCFKYYLSKTKRDKNAATQYTYRYIKNYYETKRASESMQLEEQYKNTNELLNRYEEVNKIYKYSYSNWASIIASFLISFGFIILQNPSDEGQSYFEIVDSLIKLNSDNIIENQPEIIIILIPLYIFALAILLLIPLSILLYTQAPIDLLYYSKYRNFIIPFERATIIETLKTYNENYSALE